MDIERIEDGGDLLAIVVREGASTEGVKFFTPGDSPIQLGVLMHPKGGSVKPHLHRPRARTINHTQEVLHLQYGKVEVDVYNRDRKLVRTCTLHAGDTILLSLGGHAIRALEESKILEIKQGPYMADEKEYI